MAWIDRWIMANRDLAELERSHPLTDAVIEAVDGRRIRMGRASSLDWLISVGVLPL